MENEKVMEDAQNRAPTASSSNQGTLIDQLSQHEKNEDPEKYADVEEPSEIGEPDSDHEDIERLDSGHQNDLIRIISSKSIRAGREPLANIQDGLERTTTVLSTKSKSSIKRTMSRVMTKMSTNKRDRIASESIPVTDLDKGIVGWESEDDPAMPLNFPDNRKWMLLALVSSITFISPLASSMFAPGVGFMNEDFGNTSVLLSAFVVSVFVLGYAIGPLFLSPLSEMYGRRPVLAAANVFFVVWQIGCALAPNISSLIAFRFLAGCGGSGCLTIGGGVISDLFRAERRGVATAVYSLGPLFGPVIGPVCGGFIAQRAGWRWVFWVLLIASGICAAGIEVLNKETNHRVLIRHKTEKLRIELNRPELRSCYDPVDSTPHTKAQIMRNGLLRPLKMLFTSPIVFLLSLYMSVVYGLLYLFFTTITSVFESTYGWEADITGLAYIGLGIGFFTGVAVVAKLSDATVVRLTKANGGVFEPEMRLPACVFFACFIPVSFFWYGWSAHYKVHWIVPIIGLVPFGFGMMGIFIPIQTYLIDSFPLFAASAVAALTASRSLFGALLPLAGRDMFMALGLGWGNSLLGFIGLALIPAPALIYKFGGRIRKNHPIKL